MSPASLYSELKSISLEALRKKGDAIQTFANAALRDLPVVADEDDDNSTSITLKAIRDEAKLLSKATSLPAAKKMADSIADDISEVLLEMEQEISKKIGAQL